VITVTVTGITAQRGKVALKITELLQAMGLVALHYTKPDVRIPKYPDGLEVAVCESAGRDSLLDALYAEIRARADWLMLECGTSDPLEASAKLKELRVKAEHTLMPVPVGGTCPHCGRPDPAAGHTGSSVRIPFFGKKEDPRA
jgi:hypothetical protein